MTDNVNENSTPINIAEVKRLAGIDPNNYKPMEFMQPTFIPPPMRRRMVLEAASKANGSAGGGRAGLTPTYFLTGVASNVNEGSALTFNVSGVNIPDGTYYWTINHVSTSNADFDAVSGSVAVRNSLGSFSITPTADILTEGAETFTVYLRSRSITGTVLAVSSSKTVNDTSLNAGYSWTAPSGWAGYEIFNGTNQRLSSAASSDWAPGTGAFTVEFVLNFTAGGGAFPRVFSVGSYPGASVACSIEGGATPTIYFWIGGSIAASVDTSGPLFTGMPSFVGNWHHVVLQRNASGWCNIYIDGNLVTDNQTANTANVNDTTSPLAIAVEPQNGGTYSNWMKGNLTNFRWTNAAVYSHASFTVMSAALTALPQTKLLMLMASSGAALTDSSTAAHTVTGTGSPTWSAA